MSAIDRAAVQTAVAIAALSALATGIVGIGIDEVKRLLARRNEEKKQ